MSTAPDFAAPELGQAEVENLHAVVGRHEQVLRFQVAMDDPFPVCGGESCGDLLRVLNRLARSDCTIASVARAAPPVEQFGDEERRAIVQPDVVNGQDVGMIECRGRPRFLLEAPQPLRVVGELERAAP